jgi:hypothetical protein
MTSHVFYQIKCDSRTFYQGRPRPDGELPSYRCARSISAESRAELATKFQNYGWQLVNDKDVCNKCLKRRREEGL